MSLSSLNLSLDSGVLNNKLFLIMLVVVDAAIIQQSSLIQKGKVSNTIISDD